jgi:hypothetical protein
MSGRDEQSQHNIFMIMFVLLLSISITKETPWDEKTKQNKTKQNKT